MFFLQNFTKLKKKTWNHAQYVQSIINNLKDRYWNMGPGNERGPGNELRGPESWTVPHLRNYTLTPGGKAEIWRSYSDCIHDMLYGDMHIVVNEL